MNAKHTPGPWSESGFVPTNDGEQLWRRISDHRDIPIAYVRLADNARLIAAAPDLLAALERIAELSYDSEATRVAREAIAKARGE